MIHLNNITIDKPKYVNIVDISDSVYFSNKYSDYISNSRLSLINPDEGGSADTYKSGLRGNIKYSNALDFGSAVHQLVLQPNEFHLDDGVDKPTGKLSFIVDYILNNELPLNDETITQGAIQVDYFKGVLSENKLKEVTEKIQPFYDYIINKNQNWNPENTSTPVYLSGYDKHRCLNCLDSLKRNSQIQKLLYPQNAIIMNEAAFLSEVEVNIQEGNLNHKVNLKFKGKLDNFTVKGDTFILNDLKTTGKEITEFTNSFSKYHYGRQIGLYLYFLRFVYPNIKNAEANIIAVQTTTPFTSHVFPISLKSIQDGLKEASKLIKMIAFYECYGYDKDINEYYG